MGSLETNQINEIITWGNFANVAWFGTTLTIFILLRQKAVLKQKAQQWKELCLAQMKEKMQLREQATQNLLAEKKEQANFFLKQLHVLSEILFRSKISVPDTAIFKDIMVEVDEHIQGLEMAENETEFIATNLNKPLVESLQAFEKFQNKRWMEAITTCKIANANFAFTANCQSAFFRLLFALVQVSMAHRSTLLVRIEVEQMGGFILLGYKDPAISLHIERFKQVFSYAKDFAIKDISLMGGQGILFTLPMEEDMVTPDGVYL